MNINGWKLPPILQTIFLSPGSLKCIVLIVKYISLTVMLNLFGQHGIVPSTIRFVCLLTRFKIALVYISIPSMSFLPVWKHSICRTLDTIFVALLMNTFLDFMNAQCGSYIFIKVNDSTQVPKRPCCQRFVKFNEISVVVPYFQLTEVPYFPCEMPILFGHWHPFMSRFYKLLAQQLFVVV